MEKLDPPMTDEEVARIKMLTELNMKQLGKRYRRQAEEMALTQVFMERCEHAGQGRSDP
jgi:hypothetical protein